jgi:chromosome segregation ATPase
MSRILLLLSCILPFTAALHAQEAVEDPQVAANAKLRAALRDTMLQLRAAQTEAATLKAEKPLLEAKIADLTKKSDALAKQAATDQGEAKKKIEGLTVDYQELEKKYATLEETLAKWKDGYAKAAAVANAKENERAKLADEKSILTAKVRDHKAQNLELYRLATEILERYRTFSVGDALKAREPFTGITRAKLDNQIQDYRDKVEDARIPAEPSKKPAP